MPAPSLAVEAVPAPRQLLREAPFWATLLACALVPGSAAPWIDWKGLPLRAVEVAIAVTALPYLAACLSRRLYGVRGHAWTPVLPFLTAAAYAAGTLLAGDSGSLHTAAMAATLLFGLSAALLAASFIESLPAEAVESFLWRFTLFLAGVSVLYAAESIFALGLRSEANRSLASGFGMDRVRGPLYGSATGYVALLPALGFAVERWISRRAAGARLATAAFLLAILGMGSRAGLMLAVLYLATLALWRQRLGRKMTAIAAITALAALAAALVFSRASAERLRSFSDAGRELTHHMAAQYFRERPLSGLAAGAGYGMVWPWYLRDAQKGELVAAGDNLASTRYGPSLYHSHSTALTMAVELGLPGAAAFVWLLATLGAGAVRTHRAGRWAAFAGAVAVASLGFFFDLFLFKNTTVNLIWWTYATALSRLAGGGR